MSRILTTSLLGFVLFSLFFLLAPTVHADITTGLVGHWTFDEGSGTTAGDSSGNGNTGMFVNGPTWATGKVGSGALSFDGVDDSVNLGEPAIFDLSQENTFTVTGWAYPTTGTGAHTIFTRGDVNAGSSGTIYGLYQRWDRWAIDINDGTNNQRFYPASNVDVNTWQHVAATWDGTTLALYKNGSLVSSTNPAPFTGLWDGPSTKRNTRIGSETGGSSDLFSGSLDDVRVYNRALSASDIQELYNYTGGGSTPPPPTPINGTCGTTQNTCTAGTLSDTADSSTNYLWQCTGSNGGTTASCSLPIPATPTTYTLTVSKNGMGAGTVTGGGINCGTTCTETVSSGTSITLTASSASGSTFAGWSGACSGTGSCTTTLSTNRSVTATFNTTTTTPPPSGGTTVSSASELSQVLASATGGTIYLNPGNYGAFNLFNRTFASTVTVKSTDANNKAVFNSVDLNSVNNLAFDNIHFLNRTPGLVAPFDIDFCNNLTFQNSLFEGDYDEEAESSNKYGLRFSDCNDFTFDSNEMRYFNKGLISYRTNGLIVSNNNIHRIAEDGADFISNQNVTITGNWIHDFVFWSSGHRDMIQFWQSGAATSNITIENNFFDSGEGNWSQTVFMTGALSNITVRNNLVYNAHVWGIRVPGGNGVVVDNNTLLFNPSSALPASAGVGNPRIHLTGSTNVTVTDNVSLFDGWTGNGYGTVSGNLVVQDNSPSGANYVGNLYLDGAAILAGGSVGLDAFIPVVGGAAYGIGADVNAIKAGATWDDGVSTLPPPPSPTTLVNGSCGSTNNACTAGTLNDTADSSTNYLWQCTGSNGGTTASCSLAKPSTPPPTGAITSSFSLGDRIVTTANINVRNTGLLSPSTLIGTNPQGTLGTLIGGPTETNDAYGRIVWWQVDYDTGVDGWSGEDNLTLVSSAPPPSTTFTTGNTIQANTPGSNLNVRATPNGTILGTQPNNSTGTVTSGPTYANSLWWWNINFTSGVDGWTAEDYLINYTTPPPADDGSNGGGTDGGSTSGGTTEGTTSGDTTSGGGSPSTSSTGSPQASTGSSSGGSGGGGSTVTTGGGGSSPSTPSSFSGQATPTTQTPEDTQQLLALIEQLRYLIALLKSLGGTVSPELEQLVNSFPTTAISGQATSYSLAGQAFTRNLTVGSRGEDVRQLQIFLNTEGFTVSTTRGGSPGLETTYFGQKTKAALIRYQDAHAETILHSLNLTRGTGYFGPSTIRQMQGE